MKVIISDGGRAAAGYKGKTGDCATRAVAVAAGISYDDAYAAINGAAQAERGRTRRGRRGPDGVRSVKRVKSNAREGVWPETMHRVLVDGLGWRWTATMGIGTGCRVHMRAEELPAGRLIVRLGHHYAAVIDGVLHDSFDSTRGGDACVYGYWRQPQEGTR